LSISSDPRLLALIEDWIEQGSSDGSPPVIAIAGAQGSGKSTLAAAAARAFRAAHFSLDDVYLTRAQRQALAEAVHPLLATRGVTGTHELALAALTIAALKSAGPASRTPLPAFDKLADERINPALWPVFEGRPSAIIIDGWCLGATALDPALLGVPVNELEARADPDMVWRRYWNEALAGRYRAWFASFDRLLHLQAPAFEVVLNWRCQQEEEVLGLRPGTLPDSDRIRIATFISHFERLTRHMIDGGVAADVNARLTQDRSVLEVAFLPKPSRRP
jgi:D-glycerate 3-kinase